MLRHGEHASRRHDDVVENANVQCDQGRLHTVGQRLVRMKGSLRPLGEVGIEPEDSEDFNLTVEWRRAPPVGRGR